MEKLKGKHNHTLTNILKVFTFALVLLFPFLVFMPSALYYGFNEHAQIETPQKVGKYQSNEVNNVNDLVLGNIYYLERFELWQMSVEQVFDSNFGINIFSLESFETNLLTDEYFSEIVVSSYDSNYHNMIYLYSDSYSFTLELTNEYAYIDYTYECSSIILHDVVFEISNDIEQWKTFFANNIYVSSLPQKTNFNIYEITETTTISENLSNSWENMWQTPLFAWTENTPFTATTNAFASVFNISQQSGIYNLLAYFITITGIYLVIDIVIGVATMITHMIAKQD